MDGINYTGNTIELLKVCLGGAVGALVKDALKDGCFQLPYIKNGKLFLGFLGGALIGAFVGMAVDGSIVTAALGGYAGISVITNLLPSQSREQSEENIKKIDKEKK
jgi:hypothetical protein